MSYDGSIFAFIGADTKDYEKAMNDVIATTKKAFDDAQKAAVNSSNQMIQKIGQLMNELAKSNSTIGQKIGQGIKGGLNIALGEIQRIASNIGQRLPEPIQAGLNKIGQAFAGLSSKVSSALSPITSKMSSVGNAIGNAFNSALGKVNNFTNQVSNSLGGKLIGKISSLSGKITSGLGNAFQQAGNKAANALTGIVNHTNKAASATSNLIKTALGISAAYAGFNFIKNAIGGAITKSADFEARMSSIKAVTGSSADVMKQFHDAAIKAGADTAFSATEAADAIEELAKAGVSTKDILNGGLTGALNLATAGELDLKEAAEIASTALNAFKKDNLSVVDAANQLAGAANASATDVHELKYGLSAVAPVASGLGLSFRDTTNALAVFAQNGLKGSDAGTSLKTMLMNLQPQTKAQTNMMRELGIITADGANQFFTAEGKVKSFAEISQVLKNSLSGLTEQQQQQALKTIFGTDAVRAATIAMNEGADGANKMQAEISKVTAAQVAAEKLNNLKGAIEGLSGSFETLQIKLGESVLPLFTTIVKYVDKLVDKFSQSQAIQKFTDAMATINPVLDHFLNGTKLADGVMDKFKSTMSAAAPILSLVGGLLAFSPATKGLSLLTGLLGGLGSKIGSFGSLIGSSFSLAAGNVGVLASKVGGLPGVFGSAASQGLSVMGMMSQGIGAIMRVALAAIGPAAILGLVVAGLGIINNQFGGQIDQLLNTVTTKGPQIIQNLVQGIVSQIPQLIASGTELIAKLANTFATMFPVLVQAGVDLIGSLVQGVGQNATSLIGSAVTVIGTFVQSIASALPQLIGIGVELLANLVQGLLNNLPQILQAAQQAITTFLSGLGQQMPQIIQNGIQILQNLINGIIQSLPTILDIAVQIITSFIQGLVENLPAIIQGGIQLILSLFNGLISNLPKIIEAAGQIIVALVTGLIQAIPQLISGGIQLVIGLVVGLIQGVPKIIEAAGKLIEALGKALLEGITSIGKAVGDFFGGIWDWMTGKSDEGASKTKATMDDLSSSVTTKTAEMSTNVKTNTQDMVTGVQTNIDTMGLNTLNSINATSTNVTNGMTTMQTNASLQAQTMQTNVGLSINNMATNAGASAQTVNTNVTTGMTQAQTNATAQAQAMNTNVSTNLSALNTNASGTMATLQNTSNTAFQTVQANAAATSGQAATAVSTNYATMSTSATGAATAMQNSTTTSLNAMQTSAQSNSAAVANSVSENFKKAETNAKNAMDGVAKAVTDGMNKVNQSATNVGNKVASVFTKTFDKAKSASEKGMNAIVSAVSVGMAQAQNTATDASNGIVSAFSSLSNSLQEIGYHAGMGLYNGLSGTAGSLYSLASSIASNIASTMRSALDIHSPSRVMKSIGGFTGEGMYIGMADWINKIKGVAKQYAMAITDQRYGADSLITTSASVNNTGLRSSLENLSDDVRNSQLSDTKFEVHNEIVGDKIYTSVKEREARAKTKDDYFVFD